MGKYTVQYCLGLISIVTVLGNTACFQNANCNYVELSSFLTYTANTLPYIPEHNNQNLNSHPLLCMLLANSFRQCSVFHHHLAYWLKSFGTKGLILMQQITILWLCTCMSTINYMESTECILLSNLAFPVVTKLIIWCWWDTKCSMCGGHCAVEHKRLKSEYIMKEIQPVNAQFYCSNCNSSYMFLLHKVAIFRLCISEV